MQNTKNPLIFVVIDNTIYNSLIVEFLKSARFKNIRSFHSGAECINYSKEIPDIVITSYNMEGMNGLDIMKKIKGEHSFVEFFFLSSQKDIATAVDIVKQGAFDYIVKDEKALKKLYTSMNRAIKTASYIKIRKGYKIGVIGFFIVLIIIILVILSLAIFFPDDFSFQLGTIPLLY